jgi:hypothetical protein
MSGALPLILQYAFMARTGTRLPFFCEITGLIVMYTKAHHRTVQNNLNPVGTVIPFLHVYSIKNVIVLIKPWFLVNTI